MNKKIVKMGFYLIFFLIATNFSSCSFDDQIEVYKIKKEKRVVDSSKKEELIFSYFPINWKRVHEESGAMRIATFEVVNQTGELNLHQQGLVTIVRLGMESGDRLSNINRWLEQIGEKSLGEEETGQLVKSETGQLGRFEWFHLKGKEEALLIAILVQGPFKIFVKLKGTAELAEKNVTEFLKFCQRIGV